jgi:hypothetical protein
MTTILNPKPQHNEPPMSIDSATAGDASILTSLPATEPSRSAHPLRAFLLRAAQMALGLGILAWLFLSGTIDWRALGGLLTSGWVLPVSVGLCCINYVFTALRLRVLMQAQDLRLPFGAAFRLTATAAFFSWCIPGGTGGDLVKMYFLGRWNPGKITEAVTITLWDRAIGLATFLMLGLIAAAFVPSLVTAHRAIATLVATCAGALLIGAIVLALVLYTDWSRHWPLSKLERLGRPGQTIIRMFRVIHGYRRRPLALVAAVLHSLGAQVCLIGIAYSMATVVTPSGARPIMLVLLPIGWVTNALPVAPGGIGVGEAAQEELFKLAGLSDSTGHSGGAAVLLSWRAVAIVVSLMGLYFFLRSRSEMSGRTPASAASTDAPAG